MQKLAVYIAGPYSKPDPALNVRTAIAIAEKLLERGLLPFCPHALTHVWNLVSPKSYESWISFDADWLLKCDAVLRIPGDSAGADREVAVAEDFGIPVFYKLSDLLEWRDGIRAAK